jgi:hypothetical protein
MNNNSDFNKSIYLLNLYKNNITHSGDYYDYIQEHFFLKDSFIRWYMIYLMKNPNNNNIFPHENIVIKSDLEFGYEKGKIKTNPNKIYNNINKYFNNVLLNQNQNQKQKQKFTLINLNKKKIKINDNQKNRLNYLLNKHKIDNEINEINNEEIINELLLLYTIISGNVHLSLPPIFNSKDGEYTSMELFGSPLNTHTDNYCSPFKFEQEYFGSSGSFFKFDFSKSECDLFICNPPFDEIIIKQMAIYIENQLNNINNNDKSITILITIPVWDSESQKELGIKNNGLPFEGFDLLCRSKFFKERIMLDKNEYKYWNYYTEKKIPSSYTHCIILSLNDKYIHLSTFTEKWKEWSNTE